VQQWRMGQARMIAKIQSLGNLDESEFIYSIEEDTVLGSCREKSTSEMRDIISLAWVSLIRLRVLLG
jgi:hypothetical protein